jgi:beta-ureidopropionase
MSLREREEIQEVLRGVKDAPDESIIRDPLRIAGIQFSATGDRDQNIHRALEFASVAIDKGAKIICFSELFCLPWFEQDDPDYTSFAESIPGPTTDSFQKLIGESDTVILCPIYERHGDELFNTTVILQSNNSLRKYRKVQVPTLAFWEETKYFNNGNLGFPVFETAHCRIGIQMGWDNFFPEGSRLLALQEADLIFAPTAAAFDSHFRWQTMICSNAIANNVFIFRINRVGREGSLEFYGKSFCVDPFGELVAKPVFHKDAVVIADIDLSAITVARKEFPFIRERRIELYSDLVK